MKKYYLISFNTEYLWNGVLAESTDLEHLQLELTNSIKSDLVDVVGLDSDKAMALIIKALASDDGVYSCLTIDCDSNGPRSATIRYGDDYEIYTSIAEKDVPSYHIEALCYDHNIHVDPYTESYDDVHYTDYSHAMVAAQMLALSEAQELNEGNRDTVGGADACWFSADENCDESDGYDYVVRCWDGKDYRPVTKYKVVQD